MRYSVHLDGSIERFDSLSDAADCAIDDPDGSKLMVFDSTDQRWLSGAEILMAYVRPRQRKARV